MVAALLAAFAAPAAQADGDGKVHARLHGLQEVPVVSTPGSGEFEAVLNDDGSIDWTLTYRDLQADALQAHIHVAQRDVNGGIVLWLCKTTQTAPTNNICPARAGTVSGTFMAGDVVAVTAQGIAAGDLAEVIALMRRGLAYANVHTTQSTGGEIRAQLRLRGMRKGDRDD
jgi:hypothetical protein